MRQSPSQLKTHTLLELRARQMRCWLSMPEQRLWHAIRGGRLGVQFRRQVPLAGRYVADFVAPAARLVVEVDGAHHRHRGAADRRRDAKLRRLGYRVLRLEAELVLRDLPTALELVRRALALEAPP